MPEPTSAPASSEPPSKVQELIDSYLSPEDTAIDPVLDRPLNRVAAEAPASKPAAPTSPTSPAATTTANVNKHPGTLLAWCQKLNIPRDEIENTTTAELWDTVKNLNAIESMHGDQTRPKPTVTPSTTPAVPLKPEAIKLDFGPNTDQLAPEFLEAINHAMKPLLEEIAMLRGLSTDVNGVKQHLAQQQANQQFRMIDKQFEKLGPEFESVFGKGSRNDIPAGGPEFKRRLAVVREAAATLRPNGDLATAIRETAQTMFGGLAGAASVSAAPAPARPRAQNGQLAKTAAEEADEWQQAQLQRPTNRLPDENKGKDRDRDAARAIHALVAGAKGRHVVNGEASLDQFPDG